ncbi:MAG: helix-turn-helix domain-containing protein [Candidatus Omnitrophota bacterium]
MSEENLLNIREAAEYLGVGERAVKELVDDGKLPAYKIGGTFLRFKKSQLILFKTNQENNTGETKPKKVRPEAMPAPTQRAMPVREGSKGVDAIKDFFYFNDFYILSVVFIVIAVVLIIAT